MAVCRDQTAGELIQFIANGTDYGSIDFASGAVSYNTSSDHRLKENVIEMTDATTRLKQLQPKRFNFIADLFKGLIFRKHQMKKYGLSNLDLTKVPSRTFIKKAIKEVKQRYPNLYKVLVEERNQVMAERLSHLIKTFPDKNILAIMGAGHEIEILNLIKQQ